MKEALSGLLKSLHAFGRAEKEDVGAPVREEPHRHDAGPAVDLILERLRVRNGETGRIENAAAVVGHKVAQLHRGAEPRDGA